MAQQPLNKRDQRKKEEFLAKIEDEKKYDATITKADAAFKMKDYVTARMAYEEAIKYSTENEQWLTSKVNDLDILMAEIVAREVDSVKVINLPDVTRIATPEAVPTEIKQREEAPKVQIPQEDPVPVEVEEEQKDEELRQIDPDPTKAEARETKPTPTVKPVPKQTEEEPKEAGLDLSKYPQGRTDETFTFPDHTVRRIIVKDGMDTIVYKYVTHRWGGKFYFKDDVSVPERIWKQEVTQYEEKYPANSAHE